MRSTVVSILALLAGSPADAQALVNGQPQVAIAGSTMAALSAFVAEIASGADCTFSATFPVGRFAVTPVVTATARKAGGRDYVVTLTSVSPVALFGQVRASRTLPPVISTLAALAGYDPLTCNATDLTPVDIQAFAPAP